MCFTLFTLRRTPAPCARPPAGALREVSLPQEPPPPPEELADVHEAWLHRNVARLPPHGISRIEACAVVLSWTTTNQPLSEGFPRFHRRPGQPELIYAPALWPARVTALQGRGFLPEPIPFSYFLRSPGAADILRSAATVYHMLRACRAPSLGSYRDHMLRLVAGHGPTDEDENALSLELQMDVGARLRPIFCAPLNEASSLSLSQVFRASVESVGMTDAEYAALLRSAGPDVGLPSPEVFNDLVRRLHAAADRNRVRAQREGGPHRRHP